MQSIPAKVSIIPHSVEAAQVTIREAAKQPLIPVEDRLRQIENRYNKLKTSRAPFLDEARRLSRDLMPFMYCDEIGDEQRRHDALIDPFSRGEANQSLVAKGVINLSKKISFLLYPYGAKFFKRMILPEVVEEAMASGESEQGEDSDTNVATTISSINNMLMARDGRLRQIMTASPDSDVFYQAIMHAVFAGNVVFFKPNLDSSKIYTIEDFVVLLDSTGEPTEVIVRDYIHVSKFPPKMLKKLFGTDDLEKFEEAAIQELPIYTRQVRRANHWEIQVEVLGQRVEEMGGKEDLDAPPFIYIPFLLYNRLPYAVGWLSHNYGDIAQLENTAMSINTLTEMMSKIKLFGPPSATGAEMARNGDNPDIIVATGTTKPEFIFANVANNLATLLQVYEKLERNIQAAFLLNESVRRDAERVTQEEIVALLKSLQDLLGGLYQALGRRWQRVYITRCERLAVRAGRLPALPEGTSEIVLTAGVETLEDDTEFQSLTQVLTLIFSQFGPEAAKYFNKQEIFTRLANLKGISKEGLIYSEEELQSELGVQQIIQIAEQLGPQGPQLIAGMMMQFLQQMGQQGQPQVSPPQ